MDASYDCAENSTSGSWSRDDGAHHVFPSAPRSLAVTDYGATGPDLQYR